MPVSDAPPPIVQRLQMRTANDLAVNGLSIAFGPLYGQFKDSTIKVTVRQQDCGRVKRRVARCEWALRVLSNDGDKPVTLYATKGMSQYDHGRYTLDLPALRRALTATSTSLRLDL